MTVASNESPEAAEFRSKESRLAALEDALVHRELDLAILEHEPADVELTYLSRVEPQ